MRDTATLLLCKIIGSVTADRKFSNLKYKLKEKTSLPVNPKIMNKETI